MELNLTKPLALFDLETTGTSVGADKIVEISILRIDPDGSEHVKTWLINPGMPIPQVVVEIHGITDEMVKNQPRFEQVANEIAVFIGNSDLGGYNSNKFDIPMLVEEFLRANMDFDLKGRRLIDVQNIFHKMEQRTLRAAYKFYCEKELENAHSAEADIRATYEVLKSQLDRYADVEMADKTGKMFKPVVNDMRLLHEFSSNMNNADLVGHIVYNNQRREVFNFGKHKGKPVEVIFTSEPSYYDWMMKGDFPLSTKKLITSIKLRGFNKNSVNIS